MNVASLENCKRLYELSGWDTTTDSWRKIHSPLAGDYGYHQLPNNEINRDNFVCPAYDSGYLLRKLPNVVEGTNLLYLIKQGDGSYHIAYADIVDGVLTSVYRANADTPENCLALLAIKLFEEAVL